MGEKMAKEYADYMKLDFKKELNALESTADDMLTRFDEFENLLSMVRTDRVLSLDETMPKVLSQKPQLDELFNRIDRLEEFMLRVEGDLERVEAAVEQGEADLAVPSSSKLKSFFQPFFKSGQDSSSAKAGRHKPLHDASTIFTSSDYFPTNHIEEKSENLL